MVVFGVTPNIYIYIYIYILMLIICHQIKIIHKSVAFNKSKYIFLNALMKITSRICLNIDYII